MRRTVLLNLYSPLLNSPRFEHASERSSQAAHEGPVCGVVLDSASASELFAALLTHANGSTGVCAQWLSNSSQPGPSYPGAVRGQPATRLPL